jgi:tyrosyl-tRNA synthetase
LHQAWKILDEAETEVRWQSEWFDKMNLADLVRLMSHYTVAKMLARDDFAKRYKDSRPIGLHELLYPLLQAYDSVAVRADIELGGTDQTFNLLVGRDIQQAFGQPAQDIMTTPLLEGIDGIQKMSKSLDNYVGVAEEPQEIYRKILSIPDALIPRYFRLATLMSPAELTEIEVRLKLGENPLEVKKQLAKLIIAELRSPLEAEHVYEDIRTHVSYKNRPVTADPRPLSQLFVDAELASSKSEVRRLVSQSGLFVNEQLVVHPDGVVTPETGMLLRRGRHHAVRLVVQ